MALGDPGAAAQREDLLAIEAAGVGEVDGLERGGIAELGGPQPPLQLALLARRPLRIDQEADTVLEAERSRVIAVELLLEGLGHGAEFHGVQRLERLFNQHRSSSDVGGA